MLGLLGFFAVSFPSSMLEMVAPKASLQPIWLPFLVFGGLLQVYAGATELRHGNSLTSSIFMFFGFYWVAQSLNDANLEILAPIDPQTQDVAVLGIYLLMASMVNWVFVLLAWHNPHGSVLLVVTLAFVGLKLILRTANIWAPSFAIVQAAGFFGVVGALLSLYAFIADALAEYGFMLPTGKFGGCISRNVVAVEVTKAKSH